MKYIFIFLTMIFCHIIDDYCLQVQGFLSNGKQKSWWEKNAPDKIYKHDYLMALFMHSFSWSFMIMLPIMAFMYFNRLRISTAYIIPYFVNMAIHAIVDDLKANKLKINLIQDQSIHLLQILITWIAWIVFLFII